VYGAMLLLKARVEIAESNYAAAARTLQTMFALSRHLTEGPFLINGLVGIAVATLATDALSDWVGRPDSPNLYWSLTALPVPLIDIRKELDFENRLIEMEFPVLADLKRDRSPAEWDNSLKQLRTQLKDLYAMDQKGPIAGAGPSDRASESPELP